MFERSRSGQGNRAIFLDVDIVCYVEGGGGNSEDSKDVTFWSRVFGHYAPALRIHFTPRGGKPELEKLARDIIEKDADNTFVAMDRDYDDFRGSTIVDRRVVYTYGYSWENDLYASGNIAAVYCAVAHCGTLPAVTQDFINDALSHLEAALRLPVYADLMALLHNSSVLPRRSPGRIIVENRGVKNGFVKRTEVLNLLKNVNQATRPRVPVIRYDPPFDPIRYCVGHVIELAYTYLLRAAMKEQGKRANISSDHATDLGLQTFPGFLAAYPDDPVAVHHFKQVEAVERGMH